MRHFLILISFFLTLLCNSQGFRTRHYHPGGLTNLSKAVFEATAGTYITGGMTVDTSNGGYSNKLCLMGLNSQGQVQWTKKYGSNKFQYLNNNLISRSYYKQVNNMYYTGCVQDSTNKITGVLIKFNLNGDTLWQKIYRDPIEDVIPQMVTGSIDGGFLITGFFQNWINHASLCLLIKTDAHGNELWRKKLAKVSPNVQDGKAIVQDTATKKIVIVGYQYPTSVSTFDNLVILDSLGNPLYRSMFTDLGGVLQDLIQTQDKNFIAVGWKYHSETLGGTNLMSSFAVKFDVNNPATPIWQINGFDKKSIQNGFSCIRELPNEDLLLSGFIDTLRIHNILDNTLSRITKLDKNGNMTWNAYYNYKINDMSHENVQGSRSIELTSDGGWITANEFFNSPSPNPFFFVKYDSNGCDSTLAYCAEVASGIHTTKAAGANVSIYPNPANSNLNIDLENNAGELVIGFL